MLSAVKVELNNPMTFVWCGGYQSPHSEVLGLIPAEVSASSPHAWVPPRSKNKHVHLESELVFGVLLQRELHRARSAIWWSMRVDTRDASVVMWPKPEKSNNRTFQPHLMTLSDFLCEFIFFFCSCTGTTVSGPWRQKAGFF